MAWNEPGNKGQDPWGNKSGGNDKGPPDLDEVFRNLSKRFGGKGKGIGSGSLIIVLVLALAVWFLSGFYTIKTAERGVLLRFGEYVGEVGPGLRWKANFIEEVFPVDVETFRAIQASGSILTADENIVVVELAVQYKVSDPFQYLFSAVDPNQSLNEATDAALRYVVGHSRMDDILTTGRDKIRTDTWAELEKIIQPYQLGLTIVDVNFLPARPPEEVKAAFDDAIAAQEDEQRFIREAEAYKREIEPRARGQEQRIAEDARAYREQVVQQAEGAAARFEKLLPEYKAAPEVTRQRMYIDTMQEVLSGNNKVLIDSKSSGNLMYLPLDKMISKPVAPASVQETGVASSPQADSNSANSNVTTPSPVRPTREERMREGRN